MVKYSSHRDMLIAICDGCGKQEDLYKSQTDRLLANDWFREHGWKTMKHHGKWMNICPDCKLAYQQALRDQFVQNVTKRGTE